jgi:hypothetical protein
MKFVVDEEKYQEFQRRKAEVKTADEKTAEASQADEERKDRGQKAAEATQADEMVTAREDRENVPGSE